MICVFCQEQIGKGEEVFVTTCAHRFHNKCWIEYVAHQQTNLVCPICKTSQTESDASKSETQITIVVASTSTTNYDTHNDFTMCEREKSTCCCSKNQLLIIALLIIILVITVSCVVVITEP